MKRALEILHTPAAGYVPFSLEVKAPGTLRTILTGYEPASALISAAGAAPPPPRPIPALVFEVDPEGAPARRSFVWLPAGRAVAFPGELVYLATYVDEASGMPLFLYEAHATTTLPEACAVHRFQDGACVLCGLPDVD